MFPVPSHLLCELAEDEGYQFKREGGGFRLYQNRSGRSHSVPIKEGPSDYIEAELCLLQIGYDQDRIDAILSPYQTA